MSSTPSFLQALELGPDADEAAVRRAYATRLRQIDQERDLAGFQALRDAFEQALHWLARRHVPPREEEAPAPEAPDALPTSASPPSPDEHPGAFIASAQGLGEAVFADLARAMLAAGILDERHATRLLSSTLADPRLDNIDARTCFELLVASRLVEGWRPGHEMLFQPACDAFGWEAERQRLAIHGPVGEHLDAAIHERLLFLRQSGAACERQEDMIRRLRDPEPPTDSELRARMPAILLLLRRFPNFMHVFAPPANVQAWLARWQVLYAERHATTPAGRGDETAPAAAAPGNAVPRGTPAEAKSHPTSLRSLAVLLVSATLLLALGLSWMQDPAASTRSRVDRPPAAAAAPPASIASAPSSDPDLDDRQRQVEQALAQALAAPVAHKAVRAR